MKRLLVWRLILSAVVLFSMLGFLSPLSVEGQTTYYAITLNKEGSGTVKFTSEGVDIPDITKVASGTNVKITLLPDEGYEVKLAEYIEGSAFSGTPFESGDLVRMYSNLTVNVKFAQKQVQPIRFYLPDAFSVQNGELMWGNGVTSVSQEFSPGEEMPLKARADVGYELDYIKVGDKPVQMTYSDATQTYSGKHLVSEEDRGKDISAAFKRKPDAPDSYYIELREVYQYNGEDDGSGDDQSANIKGAKIDASGRKYVNIGDQLEVEILGKLPNWSVNVYVNLEEVIPNLEGLYKFQVGENMISEDKLKVKVVFKESSEDPEPPQKYTVTIAKDAGEGSLSVKDDENFRPIQSGDNVAEGTGLVLIAKPDHGYTLEYVKVNGISIVMDPIAGTNQLEGSATVSAATNITYAFKEAAVEQVEVSFDAPANGTFSVKKGETYIETGSTVETGSELTLIAVANEGYELDKVMAGETSVAMTAGADRTYTGTYQANASVTFVVTFKEAAAPQPNTFKITHNVTGSGTLRFTDSDDLEIEDLSKVPANITVSIDPKATDPLKNRLKSLKLTMGGTVKNFNVKDWEFEFTITADAHVEAVFEDVVKVKYTAPANGTFSVKDGEEDVEDGYLVTKGSTLSLTAVANEGYELDKVMAGETSVAMTAGADRTYTGTYQADGNVTFVVTFKEAASPEPDAFKITHNVIGNGTLEFTDSEGEKIEDLNNVPANTEVSIDAIPKNALKDRLKSLKLTMGGEVTNFNVKDWEFEFTITADAHVEAVFEDVVTVKYSAPSNGTFSVKNGEANVESGYLVTKGSTLTLTAVANEGYELDKVMAGETSVAMTAGADRTYTGTYQANASVTFVVTFKKTEQPQEKVTVTYAAPQNGQFSVKNGSDAVVTGSTVEKGSTLMLTAVADEGYELDKVMAGETSVAMTVGADRTYTGTYQANDNVTFVVTFKKAIVSGYTISFVKDAGEGRMEVLDSNSETVEDGSSVSAGEVMTVRVFPANGYVPEYVKVNGTSIKVSKVVFSNPIRYEGQFTMKAENAVINYAFKKADPKPVKVKMTIQAEGGKFVVLNEGLNIEETEDQINIKDVPVGTKLQFKLVPNEGYALKKLTYGFPPLDITSKAVDQQVVEYLLDLPGSTYMFTAEFAKKDELVTVNYMTPENGIFTIEKNGGSTNVPSGSKVTKGSTLTLTAVANEGYELDKVMAGETSVAMTAGADRTYMGSYKAEADVTFVATFKEAASPEPDAFKITHNVIGNGTLEFTDSEEERIEDLNNVPANTEVIINAIPKNAFKDRLKSLKLTMGGEVTNFKVEDWDFSFTITADAHVEAVFEDVVTVKYSAPSNGTFSVKNGEANVESGYLVTKGSTLTLTAVANEGYELDKVMAGETSVAMTAGADRTYTGTYQANASVTFVVTFKKTEQPQEKVTVTYAAPQNGQFSVKNGSDAVVTGSTVEKGSTLMLTAVADEGYELDKVMAGETSVAMTVGADRTYTGTYQANDNVIFTVSFKPIQKMYTVTVKATENGTIVLKNSEGQEVVSGSKVEEGSMITVVATPNEGFELKELKANDTDIFVAKTFKVEKDTEVTALFSQKEIKYTVVVAPTENGSVSLKDMQGNPVASASQVVAGTELEVVVTPSKGFKLESLLAGKENITETKKFVVNSNVTVVARFVLDDSVEAIASESVRIYPNPATDYVLVEANADAQIRLLSMNGRTLISARTNAEGLARINLSSIAAGTYLLTVDGAVRKLIVK